jgi:1,4-dihydroxy-2-naphthoate octaprenyltransferase
VLISTHRIGLLSDGSMLQINKVIFLSQPIKIILSLLAYWMGLGFAHYLGATLLPIPQFVGATCVVLLLAASSFLTEYFRPSNEPIVYGETKKDREDLRLLLLYTSLIFLAVVAVMMFLLSLSGFIFFESIIVLIFFIILCLVNALPPFRLVNRGLSELSDAILISSLSPALAFLFQFGKFNRLLLFFTFPLVLLALSYLLSLNFPAYIKDLKYERKSLLMSLTWQRAIPLNVAILLIAYLCFAAIPFLGVPFELTWPSLLTFPIAIYQVYSLRKLAEGAKPNWLLFISISTAILGLTTYLIAITFWMR